MSRTATKRFIEGLFATTDNTRAEDESNSRMSKRQAVAPAAEQTADSSSSESDNEEGNSSHMDTSVDDTAEKDASKSKREKKKMDPTKSKKGNPTVAQARACEKARNAKAQKQQATNDLLTELLRGQLSSLKSELEAMKQSMSSSKKDDKPAEAVAPKPVPEQANTAASILDQKQPVSGPTFTTPATTTNTQHPVPVHRPVATHQLQTQLQPQQQQQQRPSHAQFFQQPQPVRSQIQTKPMTSHVAPSRQPSANEILSSIIYMGRGSRTQNHQQMFY